MTRKPDCPDRPASGMPSSPPPALPALKACAQDCLPPGPPPALPALKACAQDCLPPSPPPALPAVQDDLPVRACNGELWAQAELGRQLLYGRGRPANQPCGLCWLARAAHAGDLGAMLGLSQWFLTKTPSFNLALSHFWFTKALSTGSTLALERAGDALLALNLGPEAVQKAARFYKAGAASSPDCLAKLLDLRIKGMLGKLSPRDRRACLDRLEHLAKGGTLHAMRAMAEVCLELGPRKGKARAEWLSAAAQRGDRTCQCKLALFLAGSKTGKSAMAIPWRWMKLAAEEDPEAQYVAGVWLASGRGCKADLGRAEHFLRLASAVLPKAKAFLGMLLVRGEDAGRRDEGTRLLASAASLGIADACFELGNMALAEHNVEEATSRFLQAGQHAPSLRRLAEMRLDALRDGGDGGEPRDEDSGEPRDEDSAWQVMAQAASLGDAEAMLALARHKLALAKQAKGAEGEALTREACGLLKDACRQNHPQALHELALLAAQGAPGAPECAKAMELHARASRLGHLESTAIQAMDLFSQAMQATTGREGPATKGHGLVRGSKAARLLRRAMELGSAMCTLLYGIMLEEGIFVRRNGKLALSCFRKAAQAGEIEGHYRMGMLLLSKGEASEAEGWSALAEAAKLGHAEARTGMARRCLACGDRSLAGGWLERHLHELADKENPEGMRLLSEAIERGWIASSRAGEAHALLAKAAGMGDVQALIRLGDKHAKGIGIDQNRERARQYYAKAASQGSEEARERLKSLPSRSDAAPWETGAKGPGRKRRPG